MKKELLSIPAQEYHAAEGVSASMLKQIRKCPAYLKAYLAGELHEDSDALDFGTLAHRAILEPETVEGSFHVKPDGMSFATKEGKAWKAEHSDKPIVAADMFDGVMRVRDACQSDPFIRSIISGGYPEQSLFIEDEHGTLRKSRFDYFATSGTIIPDIKTCTSAHPDDFCKAIDRYQYYVQAAYYLDNADLAGYDKPSFYFICVESSAPYCVAVYRLMDDAVTAGRIQYKHDLARYRQCVKSGKWPGYHDGEAKEIGLPPFRMRQLEQEGVLG